MHARRSLLIGAFATAFLGLAVPASAGQVLNGGFGDGTTNGNDTSWVDDYNGTFQNLLYISPGQGSSAPPTATASTSWAAMGCSDSYLYQDVAISGGAFCAHA